ncbi:hypothetical protein EAH86_10480 [Pedococcus bigeumensis]|uniref:Uncharacterized protein n=1 Tax=Pedococcus bigeumensis TaxID=433644 RepID=A0A502CXB9_9MICO|nr:hypothetical protein EAH86_10480 [Pedococcus bigeumensis]
MQQLSIRPLRAQATTDHRDADGREHQAMLTVGPSMSRGVEQVRAAAVLDDLLSQRVVGIHSRRDVVQVP